MALLQIESGDNKGKRLRLPDRPVVVGRGDGVDVRIRSTEISREHCRLTSDGDDLLVDDLGSSNGTFINGRPIQGQSRLTAGDRISFGPVTLRLMGIRKKSAPKSKSSDLNDSRMVDTSALAKAKKVSDDDVSSWLNEEFSDQSADSDADAGDTAIFKSSAVPQPKPAAPERIFDSVAEEAADIIERHHASLSAE